MFKVGDKVEFIKDVKFDYTDGHRIACKKGSILHIDAKDSDGWWFDGDNFYIEEGFEIKYFKLID